MRTLFQAEVPWKSDTCRELACFLIKDGVWSGEGQLGLKQGPHEAPHLAEAELERGNARSLFQQPQLLSQLHHLHLLWNQKNKPACSITYYQN